MTEVVSRGCRFHVQKLGSGSERVVFLHGLIWDNMSSWYFTLAPQISKQAEVLLYDMRGHGQSEQTPTGYRVQDAVSDLAALLKETGFWDRPIHLVGNSFGGLVAIAFALEFPHKTASLVLVDAPLLDQQWLEETRATIEAEGSERDRVITSLFRKWLGRHEDPSKTRLAENAQRLVYETSYLDEFVSSCVFTEQQLAGLQIPILAMYGGESDLLPKGRQLSDLLQQCELVVFPRGSHVILWEFTDQIREQTTEWLKRFQQPPSEDAVVLPLEPA